MTACDRTSLLKVHYVAIGVINCTNGRRHQASNLSKDQLLDVQRINMVQCAHIARSKNRLTKTLGIQQF